MNVNYTIVGDYQIPNIRLSETPREQPEMLGRYARTRKSYLKEHRPIVYNRLLLSENLYPHLREIEQAAARRMSRIMTALTARNPLPNKETEPAKWTAAMNSLTEQAEEMVLNELIYA